MCVRICVWVCVGGVLCSRRVCVCLCVYIDIYTCVRHQLILNVKVCRVLNTLSQLFLPVDNK